MTFAISLSIADIPLRLILPSATLCASLEERYQHYLDNLSSRWTITLRYHSVSPDELPAPWISHDDNVTRFQVASHEGWINFANQTAEVSAPSDAQAVSALERVMTYICMQELPRYHDALLFHGTGIVVGGAGHVFFGASGRGKSTVSRLAAGVGTVLADEGVIVRLREGRAELVSTPFWGTGTPNAVVCSAPRKLVPMQALYSLHHAPAFRLERCRSAQAVMEMLSSEKVATERTSSAEAWLAMTARLLEKVPLYRLEFRPTEELWEFLGLQG